jgi:glycosyltransferase involved in cell wall biosynthesis
MRDHGREITLDMSSPEPIPLRSALTSATPSDLHRSGTVPAVSVVVPNYNHARYLPQRLESVLNQSFSDLEVIILDDASTDNSREVISRYLDDPRVHFYPNETNSGSTFAQWNRGVQLARGPLVWIAESDDYADLDFLSRILPVFSAQPSIGLAYCQSWQVDSQGLVLGFILDGEGESEPHRWKAAFVNNGRRECSDHLLWKCTIPNASAVIFRKEVFVRAGGAPPSMRICGDWMTWVRMLLISDVSFDPAPLNFFRKHEASVRETTAIRKHIEERWPVQQLIVRSCGPPASKPRRLVSRISDGFIDFEHLSAIGRWILDLQIDSACDTDKAFLLRKNGDPDCLRVMTASIFRWPLGEAIRYKVWLHMLLTRLRIIPDKHKPASQPQ